MSGRLQILLALFGILLGVVYGSIVIAPDALAETEYKKIAGRNLRVVKTPLLVANPAAAVVPNCDPNWNSSAITPCKIFFGWATKTMGGCTYYSWGQDKNTFDADNPGNPPLKPITFWPNTVVTVEIFKALKNPGETQFDQRAGPTEGGLITNVPRVDPLPSIDVTLGQRLPEGVIVPPLTPYTGLTNRLVQCIRETIIQIVAGDELKTFVEPMYSVAILLAALAIIFYSYDVILNKQHARKPATWIIKSAFICGVLAFTTENGVRQYVSFFVNMQDELVELASGAFTVSDTVATSGTQGFGSMCNQSQTKYFIGEQVDANAPDNKKPRKYGTWEKVDCIIASLMGMAILKEDNTRVDFGDLASDPFSPQSLGPKEFMTMIPAAIFLGELWTSMGPWILLAGGAIVLLMIAAFMQAMLIYIMSLIVVIFLAILGPIVIPMALFESTRQGFTGWVQMMFAYSIQPAVILAYLTFMLFILDISLYGRAPPSDADIVRFNELNVKKATTPLSADELNEVAALTFPKEGTLMWFYNEGKKAGGKNFKDTEVFHMLSQTQNTNISQIISSMVASGGRETGALKQIKFCWKAPCDATNTPYNNQENLRLLQSLVVTALLLGLTLSFMTNVMNFGAQIAGLEASSKMMAMNVYNSMMEKVSQGMQGHITR